MVRSQTAGRGLRSTALIGVLLLAMVLLVAAPAAATHYTNTNHPTATNNVTAAIAWSKTAFPTTATEVLLGRDDVFADSLASGGMQSARPLLLTNSQVLSSETNTELNRLRPSVVNIMGGPSAVSQAVEDDLKSKNYTVRRFSGPTRVETAIDVARRALPSATTAIIAAAFSPTADQTRAFADSIAAGGWAADKGYPVLLTETDRLTTATKNYLRASSIRSVFIAGGSSAVSDATATELQQIGMTVRRISGPTRFDTAVKIAQERGFADASKATEVILAEGQAVDAWAAGFTAAAYSAIKNAPVVLSNGDAVPAPTNTWLSPQGGAGSVTLTCAPRTNDKACEAATTAMGHTAITGGLPKLLSVTKGATAAGLTEVRFRFTEPLAEGVFASRFLLYTFDALPVVASSAVRDTAAQTTIIAKFDSALTSESTVAAVQAGAVKGLSSNINNPEGSAALSATGYTRGIGQTRGPNLTNVVAIDESGTTWELDFVFDKVNTCGGKDKFLVVFATGTNTPDRQAKTIPANAVLNRPDASTCRLEFTGMPEEISPGTPATLRNAIARAVTLSGAAAAVNGSYPSVFSTRVVGNGGNATDGPDLTEVSFNGNIATFRFDGPVAATPETGQTGQLASKFTVFDSRGRVFAATSAVIDATQQQQVNVTFDPGHMRNPIMGGAVSGSAVQSTDTAPGSLAVFNGPDARFTASLNYAAGRMSGPTLTNVRRIPNGTSSVTLTFVFASSVDTGAGAFAVYAEDGTRTALTGCAADLSVQTRTEIDCTYGANTGTALFNAVNAAVHAGITFDAARPQGQGTGTVGDASPSHEAGSAVNT